MDVNPKHLKLVKLILEKWLPGAVVWAFGSRVTGTAKQHSDLDLVIIQNHPESFEVLAQLKEELSESNLPFRVDVIEWETISEAFRKVIQVRYEVVQGKD